MFNKLYKSEVILYNDLNTFLHYLRFYLQRRTNVLHLLVIKTLLYHRLNTVYLPRKIRSSPWPRSSINVEVISCGFFRQLKHGSYMDLSWNTNPTWIISWRPSFFLKGKDKWMTQEIIISVFWNWVIRLINLFLAPCYRSKSYHGTYSTAVARIRGISSSQVRSYIVTWSNSLYRVTIFLSVN